MRASPFASPARRANWASSSPEENRQLKPRRPSACEHKPSSSRTSSPPPGISHRRSISTSALLPGTEASLVSWGKDMQDLQGFVRMMESEIALESAMHTTVVQAEQCRQHFGLAAVQAPDLQPRPLAAVSLSSAASGEAGGGAGPALGQATSLEKSIAACMLSPDAPDRVQRRVRVTSTATRLSSVVQQQQQQQQQQQHKEEERQSESQASRQQHASAAAGSKSKSSSAATGPAAGTTAVGGQRSAISMRRSATSSGGVEEPDATESDLDLPLPVYEPSPMPSPRARRRPSGRLGSPALGPGSTLGSPAAVLEGLLGRPWQAVAAMLTSHLPVAQQQQATAAAVAEAGGRRSRDVPSLMTLCSGGSGGLGSAESSRFSTKFSDADILLAACSGDTMPSAAAASG